MPPGLGRPLGHFPVSLAKRTCHTNLSWCILALWPNRHTWNLSSRSAARHFLYRLGCGPSCLSVSRKQRGLRFVQKQRLLDYFFARIVSFIPWVPYGGYFLSSAATLRLFSAHTRALKKWQLLWTASTLLLRLLCILGALGTRTIRCLQRSFLSCLFTWASHFIR